MNPPGSPLSCEVSNEVSALIDTLHTSAQRLEELTAGEVDTVSDADGRPFLLRPVQDHLRRKKAAIFNTLPVQLALLDANGLIITVNEAWRQSAGTAAIQGPEYGTGVNYLDLCDRALGDDAAEAHRVAAGIRSVLRGHAKSFSMEYPCHSPTQQRWFMMTVTPLANEHPHGVVVMHVNITGRNLPALPLAGNEALLHTLVQTIPDLVWLKDAQGVYLTCNPMFERLFGAREADIIGKTDYDFVDRKLADFFRANDRRAMVAGKPSANEEWLTIADEGCRRLFETIKTPMVGADGRIIGVLGIARDITERKAAENRIAYLNRVYAMLSGINTLIVRVRERDELFRETCRIACDAGEFRMSWIGLVDRSTMNLALVASAGKDEELLAAIRDRLAALGSTASTLVARAIDEKKTIVSNDSQSDPMLMFCKQCTDAGIRSLAVVPLVVADEAVGVLVLYAGERHFFHAEELKLVNELAGDVAFAMAHLDKQERLDYLAYYDALTGLANRSLFLERVAQYMRGAVRGGGQLAVGLLDLERFKNINDSLGQPAGDALLRQVAQWLTRLTGDANLLARVGADHFAIVLPEVKPSGSVSHLLEKVMAAFLEHPFGLNDAVFRIAFKCGVALFPEHGADTDTLFRNAETALKKAKASGDRYRFFTPDMMASVASELTLENQLRQALEKGEFVLHYQPKVSLANGKLTGAEALIRWNDPRTGLVPPGRFIPVLEQTGLIHEVGRWALHQAVEDYRRWRSAGLAAVRIAVNVSPLQLRHRGFIAELGEAIGSDASAAAGLELEITENLIMADVKHSIASLHAIRAMGITIAVDDFGTGFSSLSYLAKLPVDTLKIDRSFVTEMNVTPQGLALVSTIINLAHALKLKVVAEGVESDEQSRLLRLLNCDEMQGFLFSRPVPGKVFESRYLAPSTAG